MNMCSLANDAAAEMVAGRHNVSKATSDVHHHQMLQEVSPHQQIWTAVNCMKVEVATNNYKQNLLD